MKIKIHKAWRICSAILLFVGELAEIFLASGFKFGVPSLAETADERLTKELVEANALLAAKHFGCMANAPMMIIYGGACGIFRKANGVEVA